MFVCSSLQVFVYFSEKERDSEVRVGGAEAVGCGGSEIFCRQQTPRGRAAD